MSGRLARLHFVWGERSMACECYVAFRSWDGAHCGCWLVVGGPFDDTALCVVDDFGNLVRVA